MLLYCVYICYHSCDAHSTLLLTLPVLAIQSGYNVSMVQDNLLLFLQFQDVIC